MLIPARPAGEPTSRAAPGQWTRQVIPNVAVLFWFSEDTVMWDRPVLIGFLTLLAAPSLGSEIQSFQIDAWRGGAYADDTTGQFSHCAAEADFGAAVLT